MTCRTMVAVTLFLALAPAASAAKRPNFYRLGVADGPAITDGKRYVAFLDHPPTARVYDFGVQPPLEELVNAPLCPETQTLGVLGAVGAGKLGWDCSPFPTDAPAAVTDVASGTTSFLPNAGGAMPVAIGHRWVRTIFAGHASPDTYWYSDLLTGEVRPESHNARKEPDLDSPGLFRTMCAPLKRRRSSFGDPGLASPLYEDYFYERPYGVGVITTFTSERITVQRCESRRIATIARCAGGRCRGFGFSDGLVTWADSKALRAYVPRTGARYSWPLSRFGSPADLEGATLVHTRQRLIASLPVPQSEGRWQIYAARMPPTR